MQTTIPLATSWLRIGHLIQRRVADVVESVDRVLLLPQPPDPVDVNMMHEEDRATGPGLDVGHLDHDLD